MTIVDRWLLPDGVDELLPEAAWRVEQLRRELLDLFRVWGYQLVMPSLVEYTESLFIGLGTDIEVHSFKVVDEVSGRLMAIRPDITPQVARIDAHSLSSDGFSRLCYADSVLHTRPKSLLASRSPIQLGAEFYGEAGVAADIEILCLMLETLKTAGLASICLDLGHVGIFKALARAGGVDKSGEADLFDALQRKAAGEIEAIAAGVAADPSLAPLLVALSRLHGDASILGEARSVLAQAPPEVLAAIAHLEQVATEVQRRHPAVQCFFDLAELRGYHYHTGLVFAAYTPGHGQAVANGGRYDDIGKVFGRCRPATGFSTELKTLASLAQPPRQAVIGSIFAPYSDDLNLWEIVQHLRRSGEVVVFGRSDQPLPETCDRELLWAGDEWRLQPLERSRERQR